MTHCQNQEKVDPCPLGKEVAGQGRTEFRFQQIKERNIVLFQEIKQHAFN